MRSQPVSGNSGRPKFFGKVLPKGAAPGVIVAVVVVVEGGELEETGWAEAASAAWTLGSSREQKDGGWAPALWKRPRRSPVLRTPRGPESACRPDAGPTPACCGSITPHLPPRLCVCACCACVGETWKHVSWMRMLLHFPAAC
jgi:hypothetical protein